MNFTYLQEKKGVIRLVEPINPDSFLDHLPAAIYRIDFNYEERVIRLIKMREKFVLPKSFYGKHELYKKAILTKYASAKSSLGVLLHGAKGSGKTLLAEDLAQTLLERGIPVIMIEDRLPPPLIRDLIRSIGPCCVIFDEFGKSYCNTSQEPTHPMHGNEAKISDQTQLLPLFSDRALKGALFILTENKQMNICQYFLDRPERIYFNIQYQKPGFSEFMSVFKATLDDRPDVELFLRMYFHVHSMHSAVTKIGLTEYGYDTVETLASIVRQNKTLQEIVDTMKIVNIPAPVSVCIQVDVNDKPSVPHAVRFDYENGHTQLIATNLETQEIQRFDMIERALKFHKENEYTLIDDVVRISSVQAFAVYGEFSESDKLIYGAVRRARDDESVRLGSENGEDQDKLHASREFTACDVPGNSSNPFQRHQGVPNSGQMKTFTVGRIHST